MHNREDEPNPRDGAQKIPSDALSSTLEDEPKIMQPTDAVDDPKPVALDGGWGWMCVLGCFIMSMLMDGFGRSYGVIYVEVRDKFQGSATMAAWIGGAFSGLGTGLGPVSAALTNRFSARIVVIWGGVLMGVGCILTSLAPSLQFMFFSFSLLGGFGSALVYVPSIVIVGQYFDRRRGIALGIGTSGSGIGALIFPLLLEYLFHKYGFFGAMLVFAGLMFNNCVSGSLFRPLKYQRTKEPNARKISGAPDISDADKASYPQNKDANEKVNREIPPNKISNPIEICTGHCWNINRYLDLTLLRDPVFLLFIFGMAFVIGSAVAGQFLFAALAKNQGLSETSAVLMLSFMGAGDILARFLSGGAFDCRLLRPHRGHMYTLAGLLSALVWCPAPFCHRFVPFAAVALLHGFFSGTVGGQRAVMLSDLLGVQKLASSFGITMLFQGTAIIVFPVIAGILLDVSGDYRMPYFFVAIIGVIGSALFHLIHVWKKHKRRHSERRMTEMNNN